MFMVCIEFPVRAVAAHWVTVAVYVCVVGGALVARNATRYMIKIFWLVVVFIVAPVGLVVVRAPVVMPFPNNQ